MERIRTRRLRTTHKDHFWRWVLKTDGCWLWTGTKTKAGYGKISPVLFGVGYAHRYSYMTHNGPIEDFQVLHHCDNPSCVNPDHLFLGLDKDNRIDCANKRRHTFGTAHPNAKLTINDVRNILDRVKSGERQKSIAADYGLHQTHVSRLKTGNRNTWRAALEV